ncbi:hypothetical protein FIBSPDRAFT_1051651 [Athelia psychrophila]|uniref:Uncharacterized protein n=1 Tax=Athelia psychrophila TaxID=1759441 RepID=A0A165YRK8_9AGAM|nr:hypothetical protein FIBSPDRAFT_1051651 [Fibularhizoctonia sp. CBS 109695]
MTTRKTKQHFVTRTDWAHVSLVSSGRQAPTSTNNCPTAPGGLKQTQSITALRQRQSVAFKQEPLVGDVEDPIAVVAYQKRTVGYTSNLLLGHFRRSVVSKYWMCKTEDGRRVRGEREYEVSDELEPALPSIILIVI